SWHPVTVSLPLGQDAEGALEAGEAGVTAPGNASGPLGGEPPASEQRRGIGELFGANRVSSTDPSVQSGRPGGRDGGSRSGCRAVNRDRGTHPRFRPGRT